MTNDLQQAYDRAMAHNAMLREAAKKATDAFAAHYSNWNPLLTDEYGEIIAPVAEALDATSPDVETWLESRDKKAVEAYLGEGAYPKVCAMAAQIAANRDMLREELECISEELAEDHIEDIKRDPSLLAARLRKVRDMADLVLAQPNAAVEKYKNQVIRDYSINSGLYNLFDYLQEKNIGTLGQQYAVNALNELIDLKRNVDYYNHAANILLAAKDHKEKFGKDKRYEIQKNWGWSRLKHALSQALKIN